MGIALLIMGLLPLMFLPDLMSGDGDRAGDEDVENTANDTDLDNVDNDLLVEPGDETPELSDPVTPPPDGDPDGENVVSILAPNDEDDLPDDGSQTPDPTDILAPVDGDDSQTPSDGTEGDAVLPVDQIESDSDAIWVNFEDDAGLGYSEIMDFEAGTDVLHIVIEPDFIQGNVDLEIEFAENGVDAMVYLEQQLVAILRNAPGLTVADIMVELEANVA